MSGGVNQGLDQPETPVVADDSRILTAEAAISEIHSTEFF